MAFGDMNTIVPIVRTRSVRHIAIVTGGTWNTLCNETRGMAKPWIGVQTVGLHMPGYRLPHGVRERPVCEDCIRITLRLMDAIRAEAVSDE